MTFAQVSDDAHDVEAGLKGGVRSRKGSLAYMTAQTLAELLASLPEEERIILTLYYVKSLSSAEIAQMLRVPERSVTHVIISGRARLTMGIDL